MWNVEMFNFEIINLTILECKFITSVQANRESVHNKSNHIGM